MSAPRSIPGLAMLAIRWHGSASEALRACDSFERGDVWRKLNAADRAEHRQVRAVLESWAGQGAAVATAYGVVAVPLQVVA